MVHVPVHALAFYTRIMNFYLFLAGFSVTEKEPEESLFSSEFKECNSESFSSYDWILWDF